MGNKKLGARMVGGMFDPVPEVFLAPIGPWKREAPDASDEQGIRLRDIAFGIEEVASGGAMGLAGIVCGPEGVDT